MFISKRSHGSPSIVHFWEEKGRGREEEEEEEEEQRSQSISLTSLLLPFSSSSSSSSSPLTLCSSSFSNPLILSPVLFLFYSSEWISFCVWSRKTKFGLNSDKDLGETWRCIQRTTLNPQRSFPGRNPFSQVTLPLPPLCDWLGKACVQAALTQFWLGCKDLGENDRDGVEVKWIDGRVEGCCRNRSFQGHEVGPCYATVSVGVGFGRPNEKKERE